MYFDTSYWQPVSNIWQICYICKLLLFLIYFHLQYHLICKIYLCILYNFIRAKYVTIGERSATKA